MARVVGDWEAMQFPNLVSIARTKDLKENRRSSSASSRP